VSGSNLKSYGVGANDEQTRRTDGFPRLRTRRVVIGYNLFNLDKQTKDLSSEGNSGAEYVTLIFVNADGHTGATHLPRGFVICADNRQWLPRKSRTSTRSASASTSVSKW
jgi:hypothetical protein